MQSTRQASPPSSIPCSDPGAARAPRRVGDAAAMREMGAALGAVLAVYTTVLAWCVATLFYQLANGPSALFILLPLLLLGLLVLGLRVVGASPFTRKQLEQTA